MSKRTLSDISITLLCLVCAYIMHINAFINWDVAWHVEAARRLLYGGDYLINLFDDNTPFTFAYYIPVILIHKYVGIKLPYVVPAYIYLTNFFSLLLCYYLIKRLIADPFKARLIYYAAVFSLIFLPSIDLGQREEVLMTFFLPYFLILVYSQPKSTNIRPWIVNLSAVLAAFGMIRNPFYLIIPLVIDAYKGISLGQRIKSYQLIFYATIVVLFLMLMTLYPDYLTVMVPLLLCYEPGFNHPFVELVLNLLAISCTVTIILNTIYLKKTSGPTTFPDDATTTPPSDPTTPSHQSTAKSPRPSKKTSSRHPTQTSSRDLIAGSRIPPNLDIILLTIAICLSLSIFFAEHKLWYNHIYAAVTFEVLSLATLIANLFHSKQFENSLFKIATITIAGVLLTHLLLTMLAFNIRRIKQFHNPQYITNQWLTYANKHFNGKKLFFAEMTFVTTYSPTIYGQVHDVQPWSNPWFIPYILLKNNFIQKNNEAVSFPVSNCGQPKDIKLFLNITKQALKQNPDFIIFEVIHLTPDLKVNFNYGAFFSQDPEIKKILTSYVFYDRFNDLEIYKREPTN